MVWLALMFVRSSIAECGSGLSDSTATVAVPAMDKPALLETFIDPAFGTCIQRVTDAEALGIDAAVHNYSQLQAWNADQSRFLLAAMQVLDTSDWSLDHDFGYLGSPLWSPTDPDLVYSADGTAFVAYDVSTGTTTVLRDFTEYTSLYRETGFEELPVTGRYTALEGMRADGGSDLFWYDYENDVKGPTIEGYPSAGACGGADSIYMSPNGDYVMVNWAGGGDARYCGLEAYDLDMNYVGKTAVGHGHGDFALGPDGTQYYVVFSGDSYVGITGSKVARYRIPDGYDDWKKGDTSGAVALIDVGWHGGHISCQGRGMDFCVVDTELDESDGVDPFEGEIFQVFLDSTESAPHVQRLAHARSDEAYVAATPSDVCPMSSYWAQPHATVRRDGLAVAYGSTWGENCTAETYVIDLSGGASPDIDVTAPAAPTHLRTN